MLRHIWLAGDLQSLMALTRAFQGVFPDSGMPGLGCSPSTGFHAKMLSHVLATRDLCMLTALLGLHSPVCPGWPWLCSMGFLSPWLHSPVPGWCEKPWHSLPPYL